VTEQRFIKCLSFFGCVGFCAVMFLFAMTAYCAWVDYSFSHHCYDRKGIVGRDVSSGNTYHQICYAYNAKQFDALGVAADFEHPLFQHKIFPLSIGAQGKYAGLKEYP